MPFMEVGQIRTEHISIAIVAFHIASHIRLEILNLLFIHTSCIPGLRHGAKPEEKANQAVASRRKGYTFRPQVEAKGNSSNLNAQPVHHSLVSSGDPTRRFEEIVLSLLAMTTFPSIVILTSVGSSSYLNPSASSQAAS